jgi:tripartite-type tricarboxylate transporter receptor subunit TctC
MKHIFFSILMSICSLAAAKDTIKIVVPYTPAGTADRVVRVLDKWMTTSNLRYLIDYRPGAGSIVGTVHAARQSEPTLVLVSHAFVVNSLGTDALYRIEDFHPVITIGFSPSALSTNVNSRVNTVDKLRSFNGHLFYGSSGIGSTSHFNAMILEHSTQLNLTHVPLKGESESLTNVLSNNLDLMFSTVSVVQNQNVKILAVTGKTRHPALPDVPTFKELKIQGLDEHYFWLAIVANHNTAPDTIRSFQQHFAKLIENPQFVKELADAGVDVDKSQILKSQTVFDRTRDKIIQLSEKNNLKF